MRQCASVAAFLLPLFVSVTSLEHSLERPHWQARPKDASEQSLPLLQDGSMLRHVLGRRIQQVRCLRGGTSDSEDSQPASGRLTIDKEDGNTAASWHRLEPFNAGAKRRPTFSGLVLDSLIASQLLVVVQLLVDLFIAIPVLRLFTSFVLPLLRPAFEDFPTLAEASIVLAHWGIRLSKSLLSSTVAGFLVCCIAQTKLAFQHPVLPVFYAVCMNLYGTWNFLERISKDEQFKGHLSLLTISLRVLTCEVPGLVLYMWLVCAGTMGGGMRDVQRMWQHVFIGPGPEESLSFNSLERTGGSSRHGKEPPTWAELTVAWIESVEGAFVAWVKQSLAGALSGNGGSDTETLRGSGSLAGQRDAPDGPRTRKIGGEGRRLDSRAGGRGARAGTASGAGGEVERAGTPGKRAAGQRKGETGREASVEVEEEGEAGRGARRSGKKRSALLRGKGVQGAAALAKAREAKAESQARRDGRERRVGSERRAGGRREGSKGGSESEGCESGADRGGARGRVVGFVRRLPLLGALGMALRAGLSAVAAAKGS